MKILDSYLFLNSSIPIPLIIINDYYIKKNLISKYKITYF
jgi:hypothetical protein